MFHIFTSRFIFIIAILLLTFFSIGYVRAYMRDYAIEKEIKGLEAKQEKLEKNRVELTDLLKKVQTSAFAEAQAREQLGLRRPGEKTIIFEENNGNIADKLQTDQKRTTISNIEKWLNYFFVKKK